MNQWEQLLRLLALVSTAVLLVRIAWTRLYRRYPLFTGLLAVQLAQELILLPFASNRNVYALIFFISEPVVWLFYYLVLFELFAVALKDYPGIAFLTRWALRIVLPLALAFSLLLLIPDLNGSHPAQYPILHVFQVAHRTVVLTALVWLSLLIALIVRYPIALSRNAIVYSAGYAVYFGVKSALLFVLNEIGLGLTPAFSLVMLAVSAICLLSWAVLLTPEDGNHTGIMAISWKPGEKERLREQLTAINAALFRIFRR